MTTSRSAPLAAALDVDPFTSLAVQFGMLLGVADFQVLAANPRGKLALHQAWLHGKGVAWGYPVTVDAAAAELRVGPGLATDGLGRDVASDVDQCLDVEAWFDREQPKATPGTFRVDGPRRTVDAELVLRHDACLTRPVPTVGSTCGQGTETPGFSRVRELARLELRPRTARSCPPDPFAPLRELVRCGALPPGTPRGADRLTDLRGVVAHVVAALGPPGVLTGAAGRTRLFPEDEPGEVVLADLPGLTLVTGDGTSGLAEPVAVDLSVRRTHLPPWVIAELVAELLDGTSGETCASDAGGPRVERIQRTDRRVVVEFDGPVVPGTVGPALDLRSFDAAAAEPRWSDPVAVTPVVEGTQLRFDLPAAPTADVTYRLVLRGTGSTPLVGLVDGRPVPLAGRVGGPPGSDADGHDVTRLFRPAGSAS